MRAAGSTAIEPTVQMGDEYTKATLQLSDGIESWARLEAFDPQRPKMASVCPPSVHSLAGAACFGTEHS